MMADAESGLGRILKAELELVGEDAGVNPIPAIVFCVVVGLGVLHYVLRGQAHPGWRAALVLLYLYSLYEVIALKSYYLGWRFLILTAAVLVSLWAYDKMSHRD